ncbi:MAG: dihydrofolate reductase [Hellea sp.]|nr:dihydrofolate reductase [Hellea sp.]
MLSNPKLSLIVAKSLNRVIGLNGNLPWRLSSDLKFFKSTTLGKPVLMGRVTWESLPFPLPGRPNLVLTNNKNYLAEGAEIFNSADEMIARGYELAGQMNVDEVMLIGGAKLYASQMKYCDRLYVSEVNATIEGDVYFPEIDTNIWKLVSETEFSKDVKDDYSFKVQVFERA